MPKEIYSDLEQKKLKFLTSEELKQRQVFDLDQKDAKQRFLDQYQNKASRKQALKEQSLEETENESKLISKVLSDQKMNLDEATKSRLLLRQRTNMSHILINSKKMFGDSKTMTRVKTGVQNIENLLSQERDANTPMTLEEITNIESAYKQAISECQNYLVTKTTHTRSDRYIMVRDKMLSMMEELSRISTIKEIVLYDKDSEYAKVNNGYALIFSGKLKNSLDRKPNNPNHPAIKAEANKKIDTGAMDESAKLMVDMLMQNVERAKFGAQAGDDNSNITSFLYNTLQAFPKGEHAVYLHSGFAGYKGKDLKRTCKDKKGNTIVSNTLIMLKQDADDNLTLQVGDQKVALSKASTILSYLQGKMIEKESVFGEQFSNACMSSLIEKVESKQSEDPQADEASIRSDFAQIMKTRYGIKANELAGLSISDIMTEMKKIIRKEEVSAVNIRALIYEKTHKEQVLTESSQQLLDNIDANTLLLQPMEEDLKRLHEEKKLHEEQSKKYEQFRVEAKQRDELFGGPISDQKEKKKAARDWKESFKTQKEALLEQKEMIPLEEEKFKLKRPEIWENVRKRDDILNQINVISAEIDQNIHRAAQIKEQISNEKKTSVKKRLEKERQALIKKANEIRDTDMAPKYAEFTELAAIVDEYDKLKFKMKQDEDKIDGQIKDLETRMSDLDKWLEDNDMLDSYESMLQTSEETIEDLEERTQKDEFRELRKPAVDILSAFSRIQPDEFDALNAVQLRDMAKLVLTKSITVEQIFAELKSISKKSYIATDSDEDTMVNTHETIEKLKYTQDKKNATAVNKKVNMQKKEKEAPKEDDWNETEKTVMNLMSDLIYSSDTWVADENVNKPGERIRNIFKKDENMMLILKLAANPALLDPMIDRLPIPGEATELKNAFHDTLKEVLDTSSMEPGFIRNQVETVKNPSAWILYRKGILGTIISNSAMTERFAKIDQSIDDYISGNMDQIQKKIDDAVDSIFGKKGDKKKENKEKKSEEDLTDREKLQKMCEGNYSADKGEGLFMKKILQKYFGQVSKLDRRSMIAFALREAKPKEAGKILTEKDIKDDFGRYLSGIFKGAGPLLQKMLQGMPADFVPEGLKSAFQDVKENLLPIPEEIVKTQLFDIVERSHGGIEKIDIVKSLGAASVGQAFLCKIYGPTIDEKGKEVVIKLLRPDVQNRMMREKNIMLGAAGEVGPGMLLTYKGRLNEIEKELDLTKEAHNVELGAIYDKTSFKDGKSDHVVSMKLNNLVEASPNTMVLEKADGVTVDKYIKSVDEKLMKSLEPMLKLNEKQQHIRGEKILELVEDTSEINTEAIRADLLNELKEMTKRQQYLINFTRKWVDEGMFKSGFYHGDLHAGNIMISDKEATIIDFGNAVQFDQKQKDNVIRMLAATVVGDAGIFEDAFCDLMSKDPEVQQVLEEKRGEVKQIIKEVLDLGTGQDSGFRVGAILARLQEIGIQIPNEVYSFNQSQMRLAQTVQSLNDRIDKIQEYLKKIPSQEKVLGGAASLADFMRSHSKKFDATKEYTIWALLDNVLDRYLASYLTGEMTDETERKYLDQIFEIPQIKTQMKKQRKIIDDAEARLKDENLSEQEKASLKDIIKTALSEINKAIKQSRNKSETTHEDVVNDLESYYPTGGELQRPSETNDFFDLGIIDETTERNLAVYMNEGKYGSLAKNIKTAFAEAKRLQEKLNDKATPAEQINDLKLAELDQLDIIKNKMVIIQIKEISELKKDEVMASKDSKEQKIISYKPNDFGDSVGDVLMDNKWSAAYTVGLGFVAKTFFKTMFE